MFICTNKTVKYPQGPTELLPKNVWDQPNKELYQNLGRKGSF